jgi:hypothetical protein
MGEDSGSQLVCAACGAIGVYEPCLTVVGGEPVEISWLSLAKNEREAARAMWHLSPRLLLAGTPNARDG